MKHIRTPIERHTVPRDYNRQYYTSTLRPTEAGRIEYCLQAAKAANSRYIYEKAIEKVLKGEERANYDRQVINNRYGKAIKEQDQEIITAIVCRKDTVSCIDELNRIDYKRETTKK